MSTRASRLSPLQPEEELMGSGRFDLNSFVRKNSTALTTLSLALGVGLVLVFSLWSFKSISDLNTKLSAQAAKPMATTAMATPAGGGTHSASVLGQPETVAPASTATFPAPAETGRFPGQVTGPAIVEWWDGASRSGIFALPEGENFTYEEEGSWWRFSSRADLETRYAVHRSEYLTKGVGNEGRP